MFKQSDVPENRGAFFVVCLSWRMLGSMSKATTPHDPSFFWYDLETSGFNPREARIMQFAGQRTNLQLEPIGEPVDILIKLTPDVVPDVDALMVTGISPQKTLDEGVCEAEFLQLFHTQVATPGTIFAGYNSVRFDDEFIRYLNYRNFYDAYEWQWQDGRSRWDLLDVMRMTRALRPEGIEWPFASNGKASNKLEFLTKLNKLDHENAHDALSDVNATIAVARLIREKQPKLFDFLLDMRDKKKVAALAGSKKPFVYTSGKYSAEHEKTSVVVALANHPKKQGALVYDLRYDPDEFAGLSIPDLVEAWRWKKPDEPGVRLPVKTLQFNRCPAVAPLGTLDDGSQKRLSIDLRVITQHHQKLAALPDFADKLLQALVIMDKKQQAELLRNEQTVDAKLYDGFFEAGDKQMMRAVRAAAPDALSPKQFAFRDGRLSALLPLYKARNFAKSLDADERSAWDAFCQHRLLDGGQRSRLAKFVARLQAVVATSGLTKNQEYILEELKLYAESIMPIPDDGEAAA